MLVRKLPPGPKVGLPRLRHGVVHLALDLLDVNVDLVEAELGPDLAEDVLVLSLLLVLLLLIPLLPVVVLLLRVLLLLLRVLLALPLLRVLLLLLLLLLLGAAVRVVILSRRWVFQNFVSFVDQPELRLLSGMQVGVTFLGGGKIRFLDLLRGGRAPNTQDCVVALRRII